MTALSPLRRPSRSPTSGDLRVTVARRYVFLFYIDMNFFLSIWGNVGRG